MQPLQRASGHQKAKPKKQNIQRGHSKPPREFPTAAKAVVAGFAVAALLGTWIMVAPTTGGPPQAVCALLVDRTHSSFDPRTEAAYERAANQTVEGCKEKRAVFQIFYFDNFDEKLKRPQIDDFDEEGESSSQFIPLQQPERRRETVGTQDQEKRVAFAERAVANVFELEEQRGQGHGSNVLGAIKATSEVMQAEAEDLGVDELYLVVLTDGYQSGGELGFRTWFKNPDSEISDVLDYVAELNSVPNLANTEISFVGVGRGIEREVVPEWYDAKVSDFWWEFVEQSGGTMCFYSVTPASLPVDCDQTRVVSGG
jgi:hypothetical protein